MSEHRHRIRVCLLMVAATAAFLTLTAVHPNAARTAAPIYLAALAVLWIADRTVARR